MMNKSILAIFFSLLFLTLVLAPTIVMAIDDSIDLSHVYDISEEEEEKGKENTKESQKFVVDLNIDMRGYAASESSQDSVYTFKTYPKPHLNLIFPPPEFML